MWRGHTGAEKNNTAISLSSGVWKGREEREPASCCLGRGWAAAKSLQSYAAVSAEPSSSQMVRTRRWKPIPAVSFPLQTEICRCKAWPHSRINGKPTKQSTGIWWVPSHVLTQILIRIVIPQKRINLQNSHAQNCMTCINLFHNTANSMSNQIGTWPWGRNLSGKFCTGNNCIKAQIQFSSSTRLRKVI